MCLCYDLIHTLQNPFEAAKYRLKYYLTFSFLSGIIHLYMIWGISGQQYPSIYFQGSDLEKERPFQNEPIFHFTYCELFNMHGLTNIDCNEEFKYVIKYSNLGLGVTLGFFMLIGFYSIIFADRRLARPGVSKIMRRLYCKKHTLYVIAMIIIQLCQQLVNFYQLFNPNLEVNAADQSIESYNLSRKTINNVTYYAIFSTGLVFAMIRRSDPFYYVEMKRWLYGCFGILIEEPTEEYKKQILQTFLASSLSSELVYITLAGLTRFICCLGHTEVKSMIDKLQMGFTQRLSITSNPQES